MRTSARKFAILFQAEAVSTFRQILLWVRVDDSGLGRQRLPGNAGRTSSLAVPMCVLCLAQEMADVVNDEDGLDLAEVRSWAVERIKLGEDVSNCRKWLFFCIRCVRLHVQRGGDAILETVSLDGSEVDGAEGRKMVPG